ncbi:MAG: hypothetical protein JXB26_07165 [Candidatus Aminicenantes bacterium]|nr:hypothetical protein [Candidatus Aminicenantes bacterium]
MVFYKFFVKIRAPLLFLFACVSLLSQGSKSWDPQFSESPNLSSFLDKISEYCGKLEKAAFDYVCLEEVTEKVVKTRHSKSIPRFVRGKFRRVEKKTFVYDYQLIYKDGETEEKRILLQEDGKPVIKKTSDLKTHQFSYKRIVFAPMVLSQYWRDRYDFTVSHKEIWGQETILVVEASPKFFSEDPRFAGTLWIRESDAGIVKVRWNQEALENYSHLVERARGAGLEPIITVTAEYKVEKNGIRFPSRLFIEEAYLKEDGTKVIHSETSVSYTRHKFFSVETDVRY